jgi:antitoxin component YwqK of YwqJK toxin-antitoxin module
MNKLNKSTLKYSLDGIKIVVTIILYLSMNHCFSQDYWNPEVKLHKSKSKTYKKSHRVGDSLNDCKTGLWKDVSIDSIVYKMGQYYNCKPFGTWYWYYPNGDLRKSSTYDSLGKISKWARYFDNVKIIEVYCPHRMSESMQKSLDIYEEKIIRKELAQYTTDVVHTNNYRPRIDETSENKSRVTHYYTYYSSHFEIMLAIKQIVLIVENYNGRYGIKYWDYYGKLTDEYYYCDGSQVSRVTYEYKLKKLRKKNIYREGKLRVIECYDKNGLMIKKKIIE